MKQTIGDILGLVMAAVFTVAVISIVGSLTILGLKIIWKAILQKK